MNYLHGCVLPLLRLLLLVLQGVVLQHLLLLREHQVADLAQVLLLVVAENTVDPEKQVKTFVQRKQISRPRPKDRELHNTM